MKDYREISTTDSTKVSSHRLGEIRGNLHILQQSMDMLGMSGKDLDWGDVGTLSNILQKLEEINESIDRCCPR